MRKVFNIKDTEVGNTRVVVKTGNGELISAISVHVSLKTIGEISGTKNIKVGDKNISCPIVIVGGEEVISITPQEALAYNGGASLDNILLGRIST